MSCLERNEKCCSKNISQNDVAIMHKTIFGKFVLQYFIFEISGKNCFTDLSNEEHNLNKDVKNGYKDNEAKLLFYFVNVFPDICAWFNTNNLLYTKIITRDFDSLFGVMLRVGYIKKRIALYKEGFFVESIDTVILYLKF